jgi:hypothetical protein
MLLLVLLAKKETIPQGITATGRCCAIEMNMGKTKVKRISQKSTPLQIVVDQNNWRMWNISTIWTA